MTSTSSANSGLAGNRNARDDALGSAAHLSERAQSYAHEALDQAEEKLRELRGTVDPMVDKLAGNAERLARQSMDMAAEAKRKAQESLSRYADVTTRYVAEQPVRSVLIAAAVGAAVALLVSSARNQKRP
jgi:ElaB/YqjD/DUF883 family membrane-anchored ribosome-binding protein